MMSVDSGVETSNDSNDSLVLQSKIPAIGELSNVTAVVATTYNNQKKRQENEPSHISEVALQPLYSTTTRFVPSIAKHDPIISTVGSVRPVLASSRKILKLKFPMLSNTKISATLSVPKVLRKSFKPVKNCKLGRMRQQLYLMDDFPIFPRVWVAVSNNDLSCMEDYLDKGLSPDIKNVEGRTPLHIASMRGYPEMVRLLLQYGANPNAQDFSGATPLLLAIEACRILVIPLLLQAGTVVTSENETIYKPIELAQRKLEILQQHEGKYTQEIKDVHNMVSMLFAYFEKEKDAHEKMEALMNTFRSRFSL